MRLKAFGMWWGFQAFTLVAWGNAGILDSVEPGSLRAQAAEATAILAGSVLLDGWAEPVAGSLIRLYGSTAEVVDSTWSEADGRFAFVGLTPGSYYLHAEYAGQSSAVRGPIDISATGVDPPTVVLTIRSPLFDLARGCPAGSARDSTGVLAGIAFDPDNGIPLPGARVVVQWRGDEGRGEEWATSADGGGRFVVCEVPARTPLMVRVQTLGASGSVESVAIEPGRLARLDVGVQLTAPGDVRVIRSVEGDPQSGVTVHGRVLDAGTGEPVAVASVVIPDLGREAATDDDGRFRLTGIPAGEHRVAVHRIGYRLEPAVLTVAADAVSVEVRVRVSAEAVTLSPLTVRALSEGELRARASPHAMRVLAGERLRLYADVRGARIDEIVREWPGVQVMEDGWYVVDDWGTRAYGPCIQSNRRTPRLYNPKPGKPCDMVEIVLDGVLMAPGVAPTFLRSLNPRDLESIEYLTPMAAVRWGLGAMNNGALVLWTRGHGPYAKPSRDSQEQR